MVKSNIHEAHVNFSCVRLILNANFSNVKYALLLKGVISNII